MQRDNDGETISLIFAPALGVIKNYEEKIGKKFKDWTDEEKRAFIVKATKSMEASKGDLTGEGKTSYKIESTFSTSDPKVERRRIRVNNIFYGLINGIGAVILPAVGYEVAQNVSKMGDYSWIGIAAMVLGLVVSAPAIWKLQDHDWSYGIFEKHNQPKKIEESFEEEKEEEGEKAK